MNRSLIRYAMVAMISAALASNIQADNFEDSKYTERIEGLIKNNQHLTALGLVDKFIMECPEDAFLRYHRAHVNSSLGLWSSAVTDLEKAIKLNPKFIKSYSALSQGLALYGRDKIKGLEVADLAVANNPDSADAYICRGHARQRHMPKNKAALADFRYAIELAPERPDLHVYVHDWYRKSATPNELLRETKKSFALYPNDVDITVSYATALQLAGQTESALRELLSLVKRSPDHPSAFLGLAAFHRTAGNQQSELDALELAADKSNDDISIKLRPVWFLIDSGKYDLAQSRFDQCLQTATKSQRVTAYKLRGKHYLDNKNYEQAVVDFSKAIDGNDELLSAYQFRSYCFHQLGDGENALHDIQTLRSLNPRNASYLAMEINHLREFGTPTELLPVLEQVRSTSPNSNIDKLWMSFELNRLIRIYKSSGQVEKALDVANHALETLTPTGFLYATRADLYELSNRPNEAIDDFKAAIQLEPDSVFRRTQLGDLFHKLKRPQEALDTYNEAINTNPTDAYAYSRRGSFHKSLENYDQAKEDFLKAVEYEPDDPYAQNQLGTVYFRAGDTAKAISHYTLAIKSDPKYHYAYIDRGEAYLSQDKYSSALADFTKAIGLRPTDGYILVKRGETFALLGKHNAAFSDILNGVVLSKVGPKQQILKEILTAMAPQELALAIDRLTGLIAKHPQNISLVFIRAYAYQTDGQKIKAQDDFNHAKTLLDAQRNL